jgi:hypothetical protein
MGLRARILRSAVAAFAAALVVAGAASARPAEYSRDRAPAARSGAPALGVQFHCGWSDYTDAGREAVASKLQAAKVGWVRIGIGWASLQERSRDSYSQWYVTRMDRCFALARARGLRVLATLSGTPGWANGGRDRNVPPLDSGDYARAAQWAAARWAGVVDAWEVWNEPDPSQTFWTGSVEQYVELLRAAYPAIKRGNPGALVVFGGPSGNNDRFIAAAYAAGAKGSFDVMATHPYQGRSDAEPERPDDGNRWWLTHVPAVRAVMRRNGDDKPIWFTEFGWSTHENAAGAPTWQRGVTEQQQADYLARAVRLTRARFPYVTAMFWYTDHDRTDGAVHTSNFGLLRADLGEKPAYAALRALAQ